MTEKMKTKKLDKRATALRDNLKRRKAKVKAEKKQNTQQNEKQK